MKWDQPSIEYLIINKWGSIFEVSQYITNIVVFKGNVQIDGTSELIHAMLLRTIIRPCMGLERAIEDKPLDPQYNFLVELPYPF